MPSKYSFGCMFYTYRLFSFCDKTVPSIGVSFADRMKLCEKKTLQLHLLYTFADQTCQLQAKLSSSKESVGAAKFGHGAAKFGWSCSVWSLEPISLVGAGWSWPGLTWQLLAKPRSSTVTEAERAGQTTRRQPQNGGFKRAVGLGDRSFGAGDVWPGAGDVWLELETFGRSEGADYGCF